MTCPETEITCREFVEFLIDYLDGDLPEAQRREFDRHLSECVDCGAYMRSYRQAVRMGKEICREDDRGVSGQVPEDFVKAILAARSRR